MDPNDDRKDAPQPSEAYVETEGALALQADESPAPVTREQRRSRR